MIFTSVVSRSGWRAHKAGGLWLATATIDQAQGRRDTWWAASYKVNYSC